ncbi:hypothetical protein BH23ACT10_BH23ACT10_09120 [soil metagenome]
MAATPTVIGAVVVIAIAWDWLWRAGVPTIATGLLTLVIVVALGATLPARRRASVALAAGAVVFAAATGARTSPWLVLVDLPVAMGLLLLAVNVNGGGRLDDLGIVSMLRRLGRLVLSALRAPGWVLGPATRTGMGSTAAPVLRGLALATPVVIVLALLLASGDAVFADLVDVNFDIGTLGGHVVLLVMGLLVAATLAVQAASPDVRDPRTTVRVLGTVEAATLLACLVALFAVFVLTQVVTLLGGAQHVLETADLTRAEYARSGFFQLLAVAALTLLTLGTVRGVVQTDDARGHRRVQLLMATAIVLTLAIVAVAIGRLTLYTGAFGLTMLRLYSMIFAAWIGVVFVALGAAVAGVGADHRWLLPFAAATGIATLLVLNAVNVEGRVVDYNVDRWQRVDRVDLDYLTTELEADAVPALVAATERLQPAQGGHLRGAICAGFTGDASNTGLSFNLAQHRANAALATACP